MQYQDSDFGEFDTSIEPRMENHFHSENLQPLRKPLLQDSKSAGLKSGKIQRRESNKNEHSFTGNLNPQRANRQVDTSSRLGKSSTTMIQDSFAIADIAVNDAEVEGSSCIARFYSFVFMDITYLKTVCNYDGYLYMYFIKAAARFFLLLCFLSIILIVGYCLIEDDIDRELQLTHLQRLTILNMFGNRK